MKKYLLALTMVFLVGSRVKAEFVGATQGPVQALATADYGGVRVDLSSGSTANRLACKGNCLLYGVVFSTGSPLDYVSIRDSDTANGSSQELIRLYNIGSATAAVAGGISSGSNGIPKPMRLKNGISWTPSSAAYNFINLLYEVQDKP